MTQETASVRLQLQSIPACVTLVRAMLSGIGERFELESELVDDLKTAVSEACNNVVIHAYPDAPGPLRVEFDLDHGELRIAVIDQGQGIRHVQATADRMGVGLAVISALSDRAEFQSVPGGGTAARMTFRSRAASAPAPPLLGPVADGPAGDVRIALAPAGLLGDVVGRVSRAMAAGAQFSLDRFSDLYLVTDEIAAYARSSAASDQIGCGLTGAAGRLDMAIGPFRDGTVSALTSARRPSEFSFVKLVDELTVERGDGGEQLRLVVLDRR